MGVDVLTFESERDRDEVVDLWKTVAAFYEKLGYMTEPRLSLGKKL